MFLLPSSKLIVIRLRTNLYALPIYIPPTKQVVSFTTSQENCVSMYPCYKCGTQKYRGRIHKRYFRSVSVVLNNDDSINIQLTLCRGALEPYIYWTKRQEKRRQQGAGCTKLPTLLCRERLGVYSSSLFVRLPTSIWDHGMLMVASTQVSIRSKGKNTLQNGLRIY